MRSPCVASSARAASTSASVPRPPRYAASAASSASRFCSCWRTSSSCRRSRSCRSSQASAVAWRSVAWRSSRCAMATAASASKPAARARRLSSRVNSRAMPMLRIVMKSRVRLKRSGPSIGRLATPTRSTGSGNCAAATARSRAALATASCARSAGACSVARRSASSKVSRGDCAAAWVPSRPRVSASSARGQNRDRCMVVPERHHRLGGKQDARLHAMRPHDSQEPFNPGGGRT